jgi:hypothetical protein
VIALLVCLQDFPIYEADPWKGFKPGAYVRFKTGSITLVSVEKDSYVLQRSPVDEEDDGRYTYRWASTVEQLKADGSGYKLSGKSTQTFRVGGRTFKGRAEEFSPPDSTDGAPIRIVTCPDVPGGVLKVSFRADEDAAEYELKAIEKIKLGVEAFRFEVKIVKKGEDLLQEGSFWLSAAVPGLFARSEYRITRGKAKSTETVEVMEISR